MRTVRKRVPAPGMSWDRGPLAAWEVEMASWRRGEREYRRDSRGRTGSVFGMPARVRARARIGRWPGGWTRVGPQPGLVGPGQAHARETWDQVARSVSLRARGIGAAVGEDGFGRGAGSGRRRGHPGVGVGRLSAEIPAEARFGAMVDLVFLRELAAHVQACTAAGGLCGRDTGWPHDRGWTGAQWLRWALGRTGRSSLAGQVFRVVAVAESSVG